MLAGRQFFDGADVDHGAHASGISDRLSRT
jgi:hypothetical protein